MSEEKLYIPLRKRKMMEKKTLSDYLSKKRKRKKQKPKKSAVSPEKSSSIDNETIAPPPGQKEDVHVKEDIFGPHGRKSLFELVLERKKQVPFKKLPHVTTEEEEEKRLFENVTIRRSLIPKLKKHEESNEEKDEDDPLSYTMDDRRLSVWGWSAPSFIQKMSVEEKSLLLEHFRVRIDGCSLSSLSLILDWNHMKLPLPFVHYLKEKKQFARPTPVQSVCIPLILEGRDLIGISHTGSGKTFVFLLPLVLFCFIEEKRLGVVGGEGPFALVLCPNRELARQTFDIAQDIVQSLHLPLRCVLCIGGMSVSGTDERMIMHKGVHLVVATPGRLIHMLEMKTFNLLSCRCLCLDEADRLMDLGFEKSIRNVFSFFKNESKEEEKEEEHQIHRTTDEHKQILLISATMPPKIQSFACDSLNNPVVVNVGRAGASSFNIKQEFTYIYDQDNAMEDELLDTIQKTGPPVLIFSSDKSEVDDIYEFLLMKGVNAAALHGGKDQIERNYAIDSFRQGKKDVLVATDMASKGLDFEGIEHVINFDMPREIENYVHRIGRTGRWGRKMGLSTSFINFERVDFNLLLDLKYLLLEAKQEIPDFLKDLEDHGDLDTSEVGCSYCGGLGHKIVNCSKLMRDARKNMKRRQNELME